MRATMRNGLCGGLAALAALASAPPAHAGDRLIYDIFSPYLQRIEGITPGAGDAKAANLVTHVVDPWPPYVANRRIPGNGERMAGAVERHRDVRKLPLTPPPIAPVAIGTSGFSGSSGAAATPAR